MMLLIKINKNRDKEKQREGKIWCETKQNIPIKDQIWFWKKNDRK